MQSAAKIIAFFCLVGGTVGDASLLHTPHHGAAHHSTPHHGAAHHSTPHHGVAHHNTPHHAVAPLHSTPHLNAVHHDLDHHSVGHHATPHVVDHHGAHHGDAHHSAHHEVAHHKPAVHHTDHHAKPHHAAGHHHVETYHNSPAQYGFDYAVHDEYSGAHYGHSETRDGYRVEGTYYVHLPDGRVQTVKYYADETGYHPTVVYEGTPTYHQEGHHHANPHH